MKISQLIEHLKNSYKPDDVVAYSLWSVDDAKDLWSVDDAKDYHEVTTEQAEEALERMVRYHDCTIGMNWDVLGYHLDEVVRAALDIGPPGPVDGLLTLTDDQFIARYKPEENLQGDYYRQRDWTVPEDQVEIEKATKEHRIWTAGDDDDGNFCISSGWHFVNRLYYIITELPLENPDWNVQVPDDSDRDEEETYILWESSGSVETFDSKDEAEDELMAMESRGLRGLIYRDKADALSDAEDRKQAINVAQLKDEKRGLYPNKEDVSN
jgi:hypothetical protein